METPLTLLEATPMSTLPSSENAVSSTPASVKRRTKALESWVPARITLSSASNVTAAEYWADPPGTRTPSPSKAGSSVLSGR
jgi:hypothetical protein